MVDKTNGKPRTNSSSQAVELQTPIARRTIEDLASEANEHRARIEDFRERPLIGSRELRRIWNARLRPFWRLHPGNYHFLTNRLIELGENYLAIEVAAEGAEFFGDDPKLILASALASARCGAMGHAKEILSGKQAVLTGANEYLSLVGRTYKDLWKASGDARDLKESYRAYLEGYSLEKGRAPAKAAFPGANAASMAFLLGETDEATRLAREVLNWLNGQASLDYWGQVTRAECELVLGEVETSWEHYRAAAAEAPQPYANLMTTRAQVRLLLPRIGYEMRAFDSCFPIPRVACFSGHRLDEAARPQPRFPEAWAEPVKGRIRDAIKRLGIGFSYSSAANGADILFLEAMQEIESEQGARARETYVNLPLPAAEFIELSVRHPSSPEWIERFHRVTDSATAVTSTSAGLPASETVFEYANEFSFGAACQKAREFDTDLILLAVWDGSSGDGRGGTADVVRMASAAGKRIEIISPDPGSQEPPRAETAYAIADRSNSTDEAILHGLAFCLREDVSSRAAETDCLELLAGILRQHTLLAREVHGRCFHLFFETAELAARAALAILAGLAAHLEESLGLHSGPVRKQTHPVSGATAFSSALMEKAAELAHADPDGQIFTSNGFAALLESEGKPDLRCEFLGHRALAIESKSEPVFRLVAYPQRLAGRSEL